MTPKNPGPKRTNRKLTAHGQGRKNGGANVKNAKIDTQKIEARFEQVRATILAHAAFFVDNGSVQAT